MSKNTFKMKKEDFVRSLGIGSGRKSPVDTSSSVSTAVLANKVLPITESSSSLADENDACNVIEEKKITKTNIKKMKELLLRAAATKAEIGSKYIRRKVMQLKNKATLRAVPDNDNDEMSYDSPKISFRWDVESCSTTASNSSAYSGISKSSKMSISLDHATSLPPSTHHDHDLDLHLEFLAAARPGSWITSDSEFVVLEL